MNCADGNVKEWKADTAQNSFTLYFGHTLKTKNTLFVPGQLVASTAVQK